jgi:hypothetical protein
MKHNWIFALFILFLSACNPEKPLSNIEPTENTTIETKPSEATPTPFSLPSLAVDDLPISESEFTSVVVHFLGPDEYVNLRSGPGTLYSVIATHPTDQPVEALAISSTGEWVMLANPDSETQKAWVYTALIALEGVNLPVVDTQSMKLVDINLPMPTEVQPSLYVLLTSLQLDAELIQYVGQDTHINHPTLPIIEVFSYQNVKYSVDPNAELVVMIDASLAYLPISDENQALLLEQLAIQFIEQVAPEVELEKLTENHGEKGGIYFYRWDGSDLGFIYVGLTENGELVTYVNAVY